MITIGRFSLELLILMAAGINFKKGKKREKD